MRSGWQEKSLGQILQLEYGKPLDQSDRKPNGRFPVYGANGEKDRTDRFYHDKASIIVGRKGSAGEINLTEKKFWPLDVTYFVTFNDHEHDLRFLYYLLTTLDLTKLAKGVKPGINRNEVYSRSVKLPPLPEQRRIVGILDEAFVGIATAKASAGKNLQNARALFESHLQSVFTRRRKGWEERPLDGLATIRTGKRDANHQVENGLYPFYTCAFGQFRSPTFSFDGASIILPGNGANVGKVFFHEGKFEAYQRTYVVNELNRAINPRFLYFCFSANWPGWIATKQFGSATNYIVVGDLKAFPVPTPPAPVQKATVEQLESFSEETQRLASLYERKLAALESLKKSLLHQAFSGQLGESHGQKT